MMNKKTKRKFHIKKIICILLWTLLAMGAGTIYAWSKDHDEPHPYIDIANDDTYVMSFLGDSLTYGKRSRHTYTEYLGALCEADVIHNYGLSKNELSTAGDFIMPMCVRYQEIDPASDFIMIWGGTNDWFHDIVLGVPADTNTTTFYGALHQTMQGLCDTYPQARIVFVTPMKRIRDGDVHMTNLNGNTLEEFANAIVTAGKSYSRIEVIDLYHDKTCDFTKDMDYDTYWSDGLHPKSAGHEIIAQRMYELLFQLSATDVISQ